MKCYGMRYLSGKWRVYKGMRGTVQTALSWAESIGCDMLVLVDGARVRGYFFGYESRRWQETQWTDVVPFDLCVVGVDGRIDAAATLNFFEDKGEE